MAQNLELIRQSLTLHPEGMCDDCLSQISGVRPRQTVNAICSAESRRGAISRERRECPQDSCHKTKLVNVLALDHSGGGAPGPKTLPPQASSSPALREQTDVLSDRLRDMNEMLRQLEKTAPFGEPFVAWVTRLRKTGLLQKKIAAMMLTVNAMRVEVVKERKALPAEEWAVVQAIWRVLDRWKDGLSSQTRKAVG